MELLDEWFKAATFGLSLEQPLAQPIVAKKAEYEERIKKALRDAGAK